MADVTLTGDSASLVQAYQKAVESVNRFENTLKLTYKTVQDTVDIAGQQVKAIEKINISYKGVLAGVVSFSKNLSQLNVEMNNTIKASSAVIERQNALMSAWQSGAIAVTEMGRAAREAYGAMDAAMNGALAKSKEFSAQLQRQMELQMRVDAAAARNNAARARFPAGYVGGSRPTNNINPLTGQLYLGSGQSASARSLQAQMAAQVNAGVRSNANQSATNNINPITGQSYTTQQTLNTLNAQMLQQQMTIRGNIGQIASVMTSQLTPAINQATHASREFQLSWATIGRLVGLHLIYRGVFMIVNSVKEGVTESIKFQKALAEIQTINQEGPGGSPQSTGAWTRSTRGMSEKYGLNITDATESAYQALSNQIVTNIQQFDQFGDVLGKFAVTARTSVTSAGDLIGSAMKSFQLPMQESERIAASFFKTIEVGRIRAEEMHNKFGQIGPMAHELGMTLDETNAIIAVTTIRGIKGAESFTQFRGVMNAMLKPSEAMQKVFKSLGVADGQEAIGAFGTEGALRKIIGEAQSLSEIAELFPNMRGRNTAAIMSQLGVLDEYSKTLDKIKNSSTSYSNAYQTVSDNPGKRLEIEMTKVANFFKIDMGQSILAALDKITNGFKAIVPIVKTVAGVIQLVLITGTVMGLTKLVKMIGTARAAMSALGGWVGIAITAAVIAIEYAVTHESRRVAAIEEDVQKKIAANQAKSEQYSSSLDRELEMIQSASEKKRQLWNQENAEYTTMLQSRIDKFAEAEKESIKNVQDTVNLINKSMGESVNDLSSKISKLQSDISKNEKALAEGPSKRNDKILEWRLQGVDGPQKIAEINKQIAFREMERKSAAQSGDQEKYDASQSSLDNLYGDLQSITNSATKEYEKYLKDLSKPRRTMNSRRPEFPQDAYDTMLQAGGLRDRYEQSGESGDNLRGYMLDRQKESNYLQEQLKQTLVDQLNIQSQLNQKIDDFVQKRKDGFKDSKEMNLEYAKQVKNIYDLGVNAFDMIGTNYKKNLADASKLPVGNVRNQAFQDAETQRKRDLDRANQVKSLYQGYVGYTDQYGMYHPGDWKNAQMSQSVVDKRKANEEQVKNLQSSLAGHRERVTSTVGQMDAFVNAREIMAGELNTLKNPQLARLHYGQLLTPAGATREDSPWGTNVSRAGNAAMAFDASFKQLMNGDNSLGAIQQTVKTLTDLMSNFKKDSDPTLRYGSAEAIQKAKYQELLDILKNMADNKSTLGTLKNSADREALLAKADAEALTKVINEFGSNEQILVNALSGNGSTVEANTRAIRDWMASYKASKTPAAQKAYGGLIRGYASGGLIHQDTIPIMAANGEFIVNSASSRRFRTQLFTMNQGLTPASGRNAGDSFSFGDINVDARGQSDPEGIAEAVYSTLRRKIGRGEMAPL